MIIYIPIILTLFFNKISPSSTQCQPNCQLCSSDIQQCYQCSAGYYLDYNYRCIQCLDNCYTCSNKSWCLKCDYGYTLLEGTLSFCVPCSQYCYSCSVNSEMSVKSVVTSCQQCLPGFYLKQANNGVYACQPCIPACIQCDNNTAGCTTCAQGFGYNSTALKCFSCGQTCNVCNQQTGCENCTVGYYQVDGKCNKCDDNCQSCSNSYQCTSCYYGYYLTVAQSLCQKCGQPCLECTSETVCLICMQHYYLSAENMCQQCGNGCHICTSDTSCQSCKFGYYLNQQSTQCLLCQQGCSQCQTQNFCYQCTNSYYLNNYTCIACGTPCSQCTYSPNNINDNDNQYVCQDCISEQYIVQDGQCVLCSLVDQYEGCRTCTVKGGCLSCMDSYDYIGGDCVQSAGMKTVYIVMISIAVVIGLAAMGFGIWACWKSRSGYGAAGESDTSAIKASYYEIP